MIMNSQDFTDILSYFCLKVQFKSDESDEISPNQYLEINHVQFGCNCTTLPHSVESSTLSSELVASALCAVRPHLMLSDCNM